MKREKIDTTIDPRIEAIVLQAVGHIQGRYLYSKQEAIDVARRILAQRPQRGGNKSGYRADPWKPGTAKPPQVIETWGRRDG